MAMAAVMAGAITAVEATTTDGAEAIIVVIITVGETSLLSMLTILERAAFRRLFLWSPDRWRPVRRTMPPAAFVRRSEPIPDSPESDPTLPNPLQNEARILAC